MLCGPITEDGHPARSVISLSDLMICPPTWLKTQLTPVHSAKYDIEHSFGMHRNDTQMSYHDLLALQRQFQNQVSVTSSETTAAPAYEREDIEDDLEDQFWEEEERVHQRLMHTNNRTISNRRYGNSGYLAAGRMHARPMNSNANASSSAAAGCSAAQTKKKKKKKKEMESAQDNTGRIAAVNSSSLGQQCDIAQNNCAANTNIQSGLTTIAGSETNAQQKTGGRKKKVKKKSRAGIAAAKVAAEKKAQEALSVLSEASLQTDRCSSVCPSPTSSNADKAEA